MSFINEKLTEEQRKEFVSRGIKRPWSERIAKPIYRTIDVERNMCLWHLGNLGRDFFEHHMFLFEWKGEEHYVIMKYTVPNRMEGYIKWQISRFEKGNLIGQPFAQDFKEALIQYAVNGRSDQQGNIKVDIDLEGKCVE